MHNAKGYLTCFCSKDLSDVGILLIFVAQKQLKKITMNYQDFELKEYASANERQWSVSEAFPVLMRKVYLWMTMALSITGFTAYGVATSPGILQTIYANPAVMWGIIIAELILVVTVSGAINRLSLSVATLLFIVYSVLNGALLSSVFLVYTASSVATVFFITAGTFAAMALIGYTTKTDLSSMGKILLMALIGMIIATIVNLFVKSTGLELIISYIGVLVFVGLTAYDSQKIKQMLLQAPDASEGAQKVALLGALSLYLDFINLFLYLLRIFGRRD
ncbi:hypothetical protein SAMN06298211_11191 [Prevotellaceae bacterium MN60]|nr:hypothetical protein SAMN06298211_11191 [Prevotellaceae bacterium MN60]